MVFKWNAQHLNYVFSILALQICDYCYPPEEAGTYPDKVHPPEYVVDGDTNTRWQSPPISRGIRFNRVTLEIDLQQVTFTLTSAFLEFTLLKNRNCIYNLI